MLSRKPTAIFLFLHVPNHSFEQIPTLSLNHFEKKRLLKLNGKVWNEAFAFWGYHLDKNTSSKSLHVFGVPVFSRIQHILQFLENLPIPIVQVTSLPEWFCQTVLEEVGPEKLEAPPVPFKGAWRVIVVHYMPLPITLMLVQGQCLHLIQIVTDSGAEFDDALNRMFAYAHNMEPSEAPELILWDCSQSLTSYLAWRRTHILKSVVSIKSRTADKGAFYWHPFRWSHRIWKISNTLKTLSVVMAVIIAVFSIGVYLVNHSMNPQTLYWKDKSLPAEEDQELPHSFKIQQALLMLHDEMGGGDIRESWLALQPIIQNLPALQALELEGLGTSKWQATVETDVPEDIELTLRTVRENQKTLSIDILEQPHYLNLQEPYQVPMQREREHFKLSVKPKS